MKIGTTTSNLLKAFVTSCLLLCVAGPSYCWQTSNGHTSIFTTSSQNTLPPTTTQLLNNISQDERSEIEYLLEKAQQKQIAYLVAFGNIQMFRMYTSIRRLVVGNSAADKVLGSTQGSMPQGYSRWYLGINAIQLIEKKAKKAGFKSGYRDDVLYIFFKGWQRPIIFPLREP
jgi:hypothetical protein